MAETKPVTFRVRTDVLEALQAAGIAPADVARAALEKEASRARKLAILRQIKEDPIKLKLGFDATEFIRKDRDSGHD